MTVKEAIIKVLEAEKCAMTYLEVHEKINEQNYIDWSRTQKPKNTTSAQLGSFIFNNDTRVKRVKGNKGFEYYLTKYESEINLSKIIESVPVPELTNQAKVFHERDLHKLLSSYLKSINIYSKTIFHEKSVYSKDSHQKWIHPDMVGIEFHNLKNKSSQALMKVINKSDAFELASYEIKREIKSDYDLKKTYFQAVSNSSWANFGYLVAFEFSSNLKEEMERLNQSFGIGIIELKPIPFESKVLFTAKNKELDFKTIDKLCEINNEFEKFISLTEKILSASDKYLKGTKKELESFCDNYFTTDAEVKKYCDEKKIPLENEQSNVA